VNVIGDNILFTVATTEEVFEQVGSWLGVPLVRSRLFLEVTLV
jgi:hypothetical protein